MTMPEMFTAAWWRDAPDAEFDAAAIVNQEAARISEEQDRHLRIDGHPCRYCGLPTPITSLLFHLHDDCGGR